MYSFKAMNTGFLIEGLTTEYSKLIERSVRTYENLFSRFIDSSELSLLNRSIKKPQRFSPDFVQCVEDAVKLYTETRGMFNPFVGYSMDNEGYDVSFEKIASSTIPQKESKIETHDIPMLSPPISIDRSKLLVSLTDYAKLDLGGFAKGWTAYKLSIRARVQGFANGLIDAGGDIVSWGRHPNGHPWMIGVANPFEVDHDAFDLLLKENVSVATSSVMKRRWKNSNGEYTSHIIDPRTGHSINTDIVQVSVFSDNLGVSEAYSKVIMVGDVEGLEKNERLLDDHRIGYIAFTKSGDIITNDLLDEYIIERRW